MNILLVQTASNYHQVVLYQDNAQASKVIADWHQEKPRETLSFLMTILAELKQFSRPDLLVFVQGPGSFTALRVGATWVNTFAYANQTPIVTLNSLQYFAILIDQPVNTLSLTFDQRRYFSQIDSQVVATEDSPTDTIIIDPDQTPTWFEAKHIIKLSSLFSSPTSRTDVLYVLPPKITQPKAKHPAF